jgi:hypothetical protein
MNEHVPEKSSDILQKGYVVSIWISTSQVKVVLPWSELVPDCSQAVKLWNTSSVLFSSTHPQTPNTTTSAPITYKFTGSSTNDRPVLAASIFFISILLLVAFYIYDVCSTICQIFQGHLSSAVIASIHYSSLQPYNMESSSLVLVCYKW